MKLLYTERAKDDVELAFAWYEKQRRGLAFEFLDCVEIAVKTILENPEIYRIYYSIFRGCVIRLSRSRCSTQLKAQRLWCIQFLAIGKTLKKGRDIGF
jgi:plasmid stabilization system protein ParE